MLNTTLKPPAAKEVPYIKEIHNFQLVDNYNWIRNKDTDPDVLQLIEAENEYFHSHYLNKQDLLEQLYSEMRGRIKEADQDVPEKIDDFWYYTRTETNKDYAIHCRRKHSMENPEEIILDENLLAKDLDYFNIGSLEVSPDHKYLAYAVDTVGNEKHCLFIRDLDKQQLLSESIENCGYSLEWGNDSKHIYYNQLNEDEIPDKVFRHYLKQEINSDELIFHEKDNEFFVGLSKTKDDKYVFVESHGAISSELYFLDADNPNAEMKLFSPRKHGLEYYVAHREGKFYILSNSSNIDFDIKVCSPQNTTSEHWKSYIPNCEDVYFDDFETFANYMIIYVKRSGLEEIWCLDYLTKEIKIVPMKNDCYHLSSEDNHDYYSIHYHFSYSSFNTPWTDYSYNMQTGKLEKLKVQEIPTGFTSEDYIVKRLQAPSHDGKLIPISLYFHKNTNLEDAPLYLYGYGSYGSSLQASFQRNILSLINRGFVYAKAHIRGSSTLGRTWYEDGKFLKKKNTFHDMNSCAEFLINESYCHPQKICISGGSAGGMLVAACINMRPDLYFAAVADVPFVDVLNTMLDSSLPLTPIEYDEWGNPEKDKDYFDYILSYSPYDNVIENKYPHILCIAGLNDQRVYYWEPTKWVQKLRKYNQSDSIILQYTKTEAGHFGASGRFDYLKEEAKEYAFLLSLLNMEKQKVL